VPEGTSVYNKRCIAWEWSKRKYQSSSSLMGISSAATFACLLFWSCNWHYWNVKTPNRLLIACSRILKCWLSVMIPSQVEFLVNVFLAMLPSNPISYVHMHFSTLHISLNSRLAYQFGPYRIAFCWSRQGH